MRPKWENWKDTQAEYEGLGVTKLFWPWLHNGHTTDEYAHNGLIFLSRGV